MKKTVVIYCSKTGFSEKYARWLAEELGCCAVPYGERRGLKLAAFETVILIGGLYAGNMAGLGWLKKQLPHLAGKRIAAVAVGCAPVDTPSLPESMEKLFGGTPEIRGFYCQGGLAYDRMSPVHRMMMAALRASLGESRKMRQCWRESPDPSTEPDVGIWRRSSPGQKVRGEGRTLTSFSAA